MEGPFLALSTAIFANQEIILLQFQLGRWTLAEITDGAAAPAAALAARAVVALASDGFISSLPALTSDELAAALGAGPGRPRKPIH